MGDKINLKKYNTAQHRNGAWNLKWSCLKTFRVQQSIIKENFGSQQGRITAFLFYLFSTSRPSQNGC